MITKHTPGPWKTNIYQKESINSQGLMIIPTTGDDTAVAFSLGFNSDECRANAKLIAAAPELLENLKNMLFAFSSSAFSEIEKSALKYAENVIKKATE